MDNLKNILNVQLEKITPSEQEFAGINVKLKEIIGSLKKNILKYKIKAAVFIGGSYAKNTIIKKNKYDIGSHTDAVMCLSLNPI
jgi:tRNA nucleotidyltransferase (CCA-adding enzyme)